MKKVRHFKLSNEDKRVETGVVQFGNDWKSLHLRGDDCIKLKFELEQLIKDSKFYDYPQCKYVLELINNILAENY